MIVLGILIGLFIGGCVGVIVMAVISAGRESEEEADGMDAGITPEEIEELYEPQLLYLRKMKNSEEGEPYNWKSPASSEGEKK
jgi:hypothetical protein